MPRPPLQIGRWKSDFDSPHLHHHIHLSLSSNLWPNVRETASTQVLIAHQRIQLSPVSWQDHRLVAAQLPAVIPFISLRFVHFTDTLPRFSAQACGSSYVTHQLDLLLSPSDCATAVLSGKEGWRGAIRMETPMGSLAKHQTHIQKE
jgi:hypothetical protein